MMIRGPNGALCSTTTLVILIHAEETGWDSSNTGIGA
jgi:hypothetical protein